MIHPFSKIIIQQMQNPPVVFVPELDSGKCSVCKTEFDPQDNWHDPLRHAPDCRWRAKVIPYWILGLLADEAPVFEFYDKAICIYCGAAGKRDVGPIKGGGQDESLHAPNCPWRLAVEYMEAANDLR